MIFEAMGKSFTLKYDFNAICAVEEKSGMGFDDLITQKSGAHTSTRYLFWAGLIKNHKQISLENVGEIIENMLSNGNTFVDIAEMIFNQLVKDGYVTKPEENVNTKESTESLGEQIPERDST